MPYFCHTHNGLYQAVEGEDGCQHPTCVTYRELPSQPLGPLFNIRRLKDQNAEGYTKYSLEREIVDTAKKEGREIERA